VREGEKFCAKCGSPQSTGQAPAQPAYTAPAQTYEEPAYMPAQPESYTQPPPYAAQPNQQYAPTEPAYNPYAPTYQSPDPQPPGYSEFAPAEPVKKKGVSKLVKFGVPIAAVLAVAVVAVIFIFANSSPMAVANKAITGMVEEASGRIDNTPLKAFGMIGDTLKDGRLTVSFNYEDYWRDQEVSGNVKLSSNTATNDYALGGGITVDGRTYDAEAFMNSERIAIGSRLLDNNYYGIKYSTFRSEVRTFGDLVGLDDQTMDMMSDLVDMIDKMMNTKGADKDNYAHYTNLLTEFGNSIEMTAESAEIESGGASVKCKKIEFVVTDDQIVKLLNDLYSLLESDDNLREQYEGMFDSPLMSEAYDSMSYRDILKILRDTIKEFERNITGEIKYSLFVGNRNRLLHMDMDVNMKFSGEKAQVSAVFDFGASAQDQWTLTMTTSVDGERTTAKAVWDYKERSNGIENALILTSSDDEKITLKSVWSPENGRFTLSFENEYEDWYGDLVSDTGEITGVFTTDGAGFRLSVNNMIPDDEDVSLTIELKGEPGAQIKQIDYISIGRWDESLLERIQDLIYELS